MGGRHAEPHQFWILIDKPYHYGGHKMRTTVLNELAEHFKGHSIDLRILVEFWEKVRSASLYGLVEVEALSEGLFWKKKEGAFLRLDSGLENLKDLASRCEWLEQNDLGRFTMLPNIE